MKRNFILMIALVIAFAAGMVINQPLTALVAQAEPTSTPAPTSTYVYPDTPNELPAANLVFERVPGPDVLTLQAITAGATTDAEAMAMVVAYYHDNHDRLQMLWREDNEARLAGIFTMYVVHISTIYGETTYPSTFLEYLQQPRAHCGTYSVAQGHIAAALGLTWKMYELTSGWHGWIEILIDGQWEMFDATTNQWISRSALDLLLDVPREYRSFYTPLLDASRPDARLHLSEGYNMELFRVMLPGLGLFYNPPGEPFESELPYLWDATLPL